MLQVGVEIEFFKDSDFVRHIASSNNIQHTNYRDKKLNFNRKWLALTKEYYSNMWEVNIAFESSINRLIKKVDYSKELFWITYPNTDVRVEEREIPPAGMHISIPVKKENVDKLRWKFLYYLAWLRQFILSDIRIKLSSSSEYKKFYYTETYRFVRSHHLNWWLCSNYMNETEKNNYKSINYPYWHKFWSDKRIYFPVAHKIKTINWEQQDVLELRAFPWLIDNKFNIDLKLALNKLTEFSVKKVSKGKALNAYMSVWNDGFNLIKRIDSGLSILQ